MKLENIDKKFFLYTIILFISWIAAAPTFAQYSPQWLWNIPSYSSYGYGGYPASYGIYGGYSGYGIPSSYSGYGYGGYPASYGIYGGYNGYGIPFNQYGYITPNFAWYSGNWGNSKYYTPYPDYQSLYPIVSGQANTGMDMSYYFATCGPYLYNIYSRISPQLFDSINRYNLW